MAISERKTLTGNTVSLREAGGPMYAPRGLIAGQQVMHRGLGLGMLVGFGKTQRIAGENQVVPWFEFAGRTNGRVCHLGPNPESELIRIT
ncbi:MAG: hypothetical protein V1763_02900 [Parcubacteria group bacterium]